jgi:hypothetical protein
VRLQGTFLQPRLTFESADSLVLSESDLLSYLVTGAPSLDIGGTRGSGPSVTSFLASIGSGLLAQALTGRFFDQVEVQSANNQFDKGSGLTAQARTALFNGLQLGLGKQLNDRTWVSLQAGLCSESQQSPLSLESFGLKIEHRLKKGYGVSFGLEPPTRVCNVERGFAPTPKQVGLDFYRAWRF